MAQPAYRKILIRCPNWVGDAVMATPFLEAVRKKYPDAQITYMLKKYVKSVYSGADWVDSFIETAPRKSKSIKAQAKAFFANVRAIRSGNFDVVVLLTNTFQSALEAVAAGMPERIGYHRDGRSWLLSKGPYPEKETLRYRPGSMIDYYNRLGNCLGIPSISRSMKLNTSDDDEREAVEFMKRLNIKPDMKIIGLNPGAAFGGSKLWSAESYAKVGDHFAVDSQTAVVVFSGPGEGDIARKIASQMQGTCYISPDNILSLGGLKAMIRRCSLLVTNDTGPRHFASALGVPSVVLIGATDARWTENDDQNQIVLQKTPVCGPCHLRVCPYNHQCMKIIKPSDVIASAHRLLKQKHQAGDLVYEHG